MGWKPGSRILGIDDGPFTPSDDRVDLVGVVTRASSGYVEAVLHATVSRDGDDATDAVIGMAGGSRSASNLVAVLTQNVTVAGFNTVDLRRVHDAVGLPVVSVSRGPQDWGAMQRALLDGGVPGGDGKWDRIAHCQDDQVRGRGITMVPVGLRPEEARALVGLATVRGRLPEPLRLAHLIAAGWVLGESRGS